MKLANKSGASQDEPENQRKKFKVYKNIPCISQSLEYLHFLHNLSHDHKNNEANSCICHIRCLSCQLPCHILCMFSIQLLFLKYKTKITFNNLKSNNRNKILIRNNFIIFYFKLF